MGNSEGSYVYRLYAYKKTCNGYKEKEYLGQLITITIQSSTILPYLANDEYNLLKFNGNDLPNSASGSTKWAKT